jgi:large subunit ribosomal protein L19
MAEEIKKEESVAEVANTEVAESVKVPAEEKGIVESSMKSELPDINPGDIVKVYQKIKEKNKDRVQVFEGQILARKHGKGINATITVRKVIDGVGVEKIFPLHSPSIEKIEVTKHNKARRAKLYYLREAKGRKAKLKTIEEEK